MLTKLIQAGLLFGSLLGTILIYFLLIRISEGIFASSKLYILLGVIGAYIYGAAAFMAVKGIHIFSKTD